MRIHRLTITAFGPFADEVDLDVDDLTDSGLFLVHGPTGAGKTSLLDAICFALYAGVPGARDRGPAASLRSHHAAEGMAPRVVLEFTASGRRLRITRSPAWTRPGRATPVPATVSLEELRAGRWEPAGSRHDEVGDVVKDVMGMDRDQFAKVVLLPQGEFAAFLRAGAEDRRKVLERLFDVSTYTGVETWLVERRRAVGARAQVLRAEVERLRAELGELLARTPDTDATADDEAEPDQPLPAGPQLAGLVRSRLESRLDRLLVRSDAAELAQRTAVEHWAAAQACATARERGGRALADRRLLEEQTPAVEADRVRVRDAARAAEVRGHLDAVRRARRAVGQAESSLDGGLGELRTAGLLGGDEPVDVTDLHRRVSEHDPAVSEVIDAREETERLSGRRAQYAADAERKATAVGAARRRAEELEAVIDALASERAVTAQTAARLDRAAAEAVELGRLHRIRTALDDAASGLVRAEDTLRSATDAEQAGREALLDLRERRVAGMAAELALTLADGPCPVCGATDHPSPARAAADHVSTSDLRAAEARHDALLDVRQRAAGSVEALDARRQALRDELADETRSVQELAAALEQATATRAAAADAGRRLTELDARHATLQAELDGVGQSLAAAAQAVSATAAALEVVDQQLISTTERGDLARQRHDDSCPCGDAARHVGLRDRLAQLAATEQVLAARRADLHASEEALRTALDDAGFADEPSARAADLDPATTRALSERLRAHDAARVRVASTLEDAEVRAALDAPVADSDVAAALARKAEAEALVREVSQELGQARTDAAAGLRLTEQYRRAADTLAPLEAELSVVTEVADAASGAGSNTRRMPLAAYVLAARLERVAALANERLTVMGEGRFELRHTDDRSGNARAGLGLEVVDLWTGQARSTATLSGGESFMASLALALALADAVREEAGGFDLQTLFIDEGFGTLDDESLEQVLSVLDSLRDGGRVVGVVSHVADLRTRIPRQVRVRKAPHGSSIEVAGASAAARTA